MKKLFGYYGGSRMYGFPTVEGSDWDYYAIGTSDKVKRYKIYPDVKIHQKKRTNSLDVEKTELCAYVTYLMNGFVFQVESLFVPKHWMDYLDPEFDELFLKNRNLLIDRTRLIENIGSNVDIVRRKTVADIAKLKATVLATKPSDKIVRGVSKMLEEYEKKGYYHKDYLHQIRILASTLHFLKYDEYPLHTLEQHNSIAFNLCCKIKTKPDYYSREELDLIVDGYLKDIDAIDLTDDENKFRFDSTYAITALSKFYP